MWFIVVNWSEGRWGFQTFDNDFPAAIYELDFEAFRGDNAELWMWDGERWMRIDFVGNMKHKPYSTEIG